MAQVIDELVLKVREQGLANMNAALSKLDTSLDKTSAAAEQLQKSLGSGLQQAMSQVQASTAQLSASVAKTERSFAGMTQSLQAANDSLARTVPNVNQLGANVSSAGKSTAQFGKDTDSARTKIVGLNNSITRLRDNLANMLPGMHMFRGVLNPIGLGILAVGAAVGGATAAFARWEERQVRLRSTLAAFGQDLGRTSEQIRRLAEEISSTTSATRESVENAAAVLARFGTIAGENFDNTLRLAQDLTALGFGPLESTVNALGEALRRPIEGMERLQAIGIRLTYDQQQLVKSLDQSGRTAEAQRVILRQVAQQVGGAGAAQGATLTGSFQRFGDALRRTIEIMGAAINRFPLLASVIKSLTRAAESFNRAIAPQDTVDRIKNIRGQIESLEREIAQQLPEVQYYTKLYNMTIEELAQSHLKGENTAEQLIQKLNDLNKSYIELDTLMRLVEREGSHVFFRERAVEAQFLRDRIREVTDSLREQLALEKMAPIEREILIQQRVAGVADPRTAEQKAAAQEIAGLVRSIEAARQATARMSAQLQAEAQEAMSLLLQQTGLIQNSILTYEQYTQARLAAEEKIRKAYSDTAEAKRILTEMEIELDRMRQESLLDTVQMAGRTLTMLFPKSKAAAVAEAVMNTAVGVTRAFRDVPWPLNWIQAGLVAAAGAAQIAAIRSTNMSGGGGLPSPGATGGVSAAPATSQPAPPMRAINITMRKGDFWSSEAVAELISRINDEAQNGRIVIATRTIPM